MKYRAAVVALVIAGAESIVAARCAAQGRRLELTPLLGWYLPTSSIAQAVADPHCGGVAQAFSRLPQATIQAVQTPYYDCGAVLKQATGPALGGRITGWLTKRFAVELSLTYVLSHAVAYPTGTGEGGFDLDMPAHLATGSARVLFSLAPKGGATGPYVAAGAGFVSHRGPEYTDLIAVRLDSGAAPSNVGWGGSLALGVRLREEPDRIQLRAELEDFVYGFSGEVNMVGTSYPRYLQNDLVLSLGVVLPILGPGGWVR